MLLTWRSWLYSKGSSMVRHLRNERGAQAIEYIGVAALVIVLILALIPMFSGNGGDSIAGKLVDKLKGFIDKINF